MAFRLDPLLRLRKSEEDRLQRELGTIQTHLSNQERELGGMQDAEHRNQEELAARQGEPLAPDTFILYDRYLQALRGHQDRQRLIISEVQSKAESRRGALILAMQKRRSLEILKERELLRQRRERLKRETAILDEVAAGQWFMRNR